jgi:hypothetical protein
MSIRITSQDAFHQYDGNGRAITTWDAKKCAWIVEPKFEGENIDWYGKDSDFPAGCTLKGFEANNPDWDKKPDISVSWYWNDKATCLRAFGSPHTFGADFDYWDKQIYPYQHHKNWGYLDYKEEEVVEALGKFADHHRNASRVVVTYNGKVLHDGPLK